MTGRSRRTATMLRPTDGGLGTRLRRTAELVRWLAPRELRVRYRQSLLDVAWALIGPVVTLVVYGIVLTQSFDVTGSCSPYLTSAWTGLVLWTFFASGVGSAVQSLVSSSELISKIYFPREALPLSMTAAAGVDLLFGLGSIGLVMAVQDVGIGWNALWAAAPILLVVLWTSVASMVTAVLASFSRDVIHAVNLFLRVGFFANPVMYESSFLPSGLRWTERYNPLAVAINGLRRSVLCDQPAEVRLLGIHLAVGVAAFLGAVLYTRAVESRITDVI